MRKPKPLDRTDLKILEELQHNARISNVELAQKVNLSQTPCLERVRRLERNGYVHGYRAVLDPRLLGCDFVLFIELRMESMSDEALRSFDEAIREVKEIMSCHLVASDFDILLKCRVGDMAEFHQSLRNRICSLPGVREMRRVYAAIQEIKDSTRLRLQPAV